MTLTEHPESKVIACPETVIRAGSPPAAVPAAIQRLVTEDNLCVLTFDRPESPANIFDRATLLELNDHLDVIAGDSSLKGLIIASAKKSIFIAGADIKSLANGASADELRGLIELGQRVFNRLAALPFPTVAAIHGACLGGTNPALRR